MNTSQLAKKLSLLQTKTLATSFLVGFDGFTDEILSGVKKRIDASHFEPFTQIRELGDRIYEAIGKSTNIELVTKQKKIGGNAPILALGLAEAGFRPTLVGALGYPEIEPLFMPLVQKCKQIITLAPSGHTDAIEFTDGKILLGKHESIINLAEVFFERISDDELIKLFNDADIFVSTNWTMISGMTHLWKRLIHSILPKIQAKPRQMFVDLADPAKRSNSDIEEALLTLQAFQSFYQVTLGLNELEARRIARLFDSSIPLQEADPITQEKTLKLAAFIHAEAKLDELIIHTVKFAAGANKNEQRAVVGPFIEKPFLLTGAGDNFNAGYIVGQALKLSLEERLLIGVFTSGFYVKTGKSPTLQDLIAFMQT
jgi:hypothetical protein